MQARLLRDAEHDAVSSEKRLSCVNERDVSLESCTQDHLEEVPEPVLLTVQGGRMPGFVRGDLIRNGAALWRGADREYTHAFDGLAKLIKYSIDDDITFSTKFVKSQWFKAIAMDRRPVPPSVTVGGVSPPFSPLQNVWGLMTAKNLDNAPVNIHQLGGEGGPWAAISDPPIAMEFDPETLDTIRRLDSSYPNSIVSLGITPQLHTHTYTYTRRCACMGIAQTACLHICVHAYMPAYMHTHTHPSMQA